MSKIWTIFLVIMFLVLAGGAIMLKTISIPAPSEKVERDLPDDQFPR